jgi:predicted adenine nucleotide alpha hydrolase (AANH) superfamily ATPase
MPTRLLMDAGHDITVFYANSNIAPAQEYAHRLDELVKYAAEQGFPVVEGNYDPALWERVVAPIGESLKQFSPALGKAIAQRHGDADNAAPDSTGSPYDGVGSVSELLDDERRKERCRACYRLRLEEAAAYAAARGYEGLATTLAVSPYQFTDVIYEETVRAAEAVGIRAHFDDYRPYYDEATRISRELGMYRQNYCGCRFSVKEGEATRAFIKARRKADKAARAAKQAALEEDRLRKAAEKKAYADAQARKRAILKALRDKG